MTDIPIVNGPLPYVNGFQLSFPTSSPTTASLLINISPGATRDSTNTNDLVSTNILSVDIAVTGAGGGDALSVSSNTLFAIYIIGDSSKFLSTNAIFSTNHTMPNLPKGYDIFRRIGVARTGATVLFLPFLQWGKSRDRYYSLIDQLPVVTAGLGTLPVTLSLAEEIPHITTRVTLNIVLTPVLSGSRLRFNVFNELINNNYEMGSGVLAVQRAIIKVPVSAVGSDPRLIWSLSNIADRVDISVQGFEDHL